jgi:hypothetical protein
MRELLSFFSYQNYTSVRIQMRNSGISKMENLIEYEYKGKRLSCGGVLISVVRLEISMASLLEKCLDVSDLRAIQARGIDAYRKDFQDRIVLGLRQVEMRQLGKSKWIEVPSLNIYEGQVDFEWLPIRRLVYFAKEVVVPLKN